MATAKITVPARKTSEDITDVLKVSTKTFGCAILGTSPLILNRMSEKAKHQLLFPSGKKGAVEKATSLKHEPITEYRASAYRMKDPKAPMLLAILSTAFKGAIRSAALDMPGAKKAQIGRLTYIAGEHVGIYGVPKLLMSVVRSADMNRTPDIHTRAIIPQWGCWLEVTFVEPLIRMQAVANLLAAAGLTIGVGDWRPEKGAGNYGQFRIVNRDDATFIRILEDGGRVQQAEALKYPVCYDDESTELFSWFQDERAKRALKGVA